MPVEPRVQIADGALRGRTLANGGFCFAGIPFATPPVGPLRFRPPRPVPQWTGVREAISFPPAPLQRLLPSLGPSTMQTSEDCLYLNVWTPDLSGRRPVMVWIYGGGFESGSGSPPLTDGEALMHRDIVFVAFNYRVGALGFLYLADLGGPDWAPTTNCGLLDQVAALHWVRNNIAAFGGDPNNVTVFGDSAGGFSIGALLAMPAAAGMFDKAIMQSGATSRTFSRETATGIARDLLDRLELSEPEQLLTVPAERIVEVQLEGIDTDIGARNTPGGRSYGAVVDGHVLPDLPLDVVARGGTRTIPLIVGACRDEVQLWEAMLQPTTFAPASEAALLVEMARCVGEERAAVLLQAYQNREPGASLARLRTRFLSDWIYRVPAVQCAQTQIASGGQAWNYLFAHARSPDLGAHHGADVAYTLDMLDQLTFFGSAATPQDQQVRNEMTEAWTTFARTGDPGWPMYRPEEPTVRCFGGTAPLVTEPLAEVAQLWQTFWSQQK
ncbi:carboxylesterase [Dictyobacter sp. S3.2.2.5]|uniref:Carboxylic ester hydrolase n=1 Tax=Dictyobacter halimunensis TaxID=3026934 RepID=A0ABQ6FL25_9CHLR|nr:carboxylesterase [Dictyobacter sp. S3.2.2.5]